MEAEISIGSPIIAPPEKFIIRYRELPSGDWIVYGDVTSNSFTLTDLNVGQYEVEITYVNAEGIECPPIIIIITIDDVPACTCGDLTNIYVKKNCDQQTATLYMSFADNYDCAVEYNLTYTQFGGLSPTTITYTENPGNVAIPLSTTGGSAPPNITLTIICCDGSEILCFDGAVTDVRDCDCITTPDVSNGSVQYDPITEEYSIQFSFTPGSPTPPPPYTITYYQLNTIDPVTPIVVGEATAGFKSYPVTVVPHTGSIMFRIKVETPCGQDQIDVSLITCGQSVAYNGGQSFPSIIAIYVGTGIGTVQINYNALTIPDKFEMEFGGSVVASSGYRGSISYQPALDAALADEGLPPEPITSPGSGAISFYKSTAEEWVIVKVYAPLPNTQWNFNIICQISQPPPGVG